MIGTILNKIKHGITSSASISLASTSKKKVLLVYPVYANRKELNQVQEKLNELEVVITTFKYFGNIDKLRSSVLTSGFDAIYLYNIKPEVILQLRDLRCAKIWRPLTLERRVKSNSLKANQQLKLALGHVSAIDSKDQQLALWFEDHLKTSFKTDSTLAEHLAICAEPILIGVGSGLGNILQATPLIRKLAEFIGHPIDVYVESPIPTAIALLTQAPWINMLYGDSADIETKYYSKAFLSFNVGHLLPPLNAKEIFIQRHLYPMNQECKDMHETEYHFLGIEELFPGIKINPSETQNYFVGNHQYSFPNNKLVGLCSGFKPGEWENRSWPYFVELAKELNKLGYEVHSFGTANEYIEGTINRTGTSLRQSIKALQECSYIIATDGGAFHIAECLGIPTIVLFGPTSIIKNGPIKDHTRVLYSTLRCAPCHHYSAEFHRCSDNTCMQNIEITKVTNALSELDQQLNQAGPSGRRQLELAHQHERNRTGNLYKVENSTDYLAESFAYYPNSVSFVESALIGNLQTGRKERAKEIFDYAKSKFSDSQQFKGTLEEFKIQHSDSLRSSPWIEVQERDLIDVYLTTTRRADFLKTTLDRLIQACDLSEFDHRMNIFVDNYDHDTLAVLNDYIDKINLVSSNTQVGLPFMFNLIQDYSKILAQRTERKPQQICYIQDDCLIEYPSEYFRVMYETQRSLLSKRKAGYVSGFYTPIHPGFEKTKFKHYTVVYSDSIDGKNIMGPAELFESVGKLSWYFKDGEKRGNPGPHRGSHFDLWQWKESPSGTYAQGRINLLIPGLCRSLSMDADTSTWGNPSENEEYINQRIAEGRIYKTRSSIAMLTKEDFYQSEESSKTMLKIANDQVGNL